jgi:hypothetical protein
MCALWRANGLAARGKRNFSPQGSSLRALQSTTLTPIQERKKGHQGITLAAF